MSETPKKKKWYHFDRTWLLDKGIELSIFVLGFVIALWIDGVRDDNHVKKLKEHYMEIVVSDLKKDLGNYEEALYHDSMRAEGCDYILTWLLQRQSSDYHSFAVLKHETKGRTGPGFDFGERVQFMANDTIQIISEQSGWFQDTSGYWINKQLVKAMDRQFNWFSTEVDDSVQVKLERYSEFVDGTKSVFQHTTGYDGLMSQNTSSFLNTTTVESRLSDYYGFGEYLNWLEDYYRDKHFVEFTNLRYSYGEANMFRFLYLLNNEQNNELIQHLTVASIHAKKEIKYYRKAIAMNKGLQELIADSGN